MGQRSAVSIARRLQDPLSELVKIDPKSIGVGQYQHDMNQKRLGEALEGVVEDCVNKVGVDLNTASASCWNMCPVSIRHWLRILWPTGKRTGHLRAESSC